MMKINASLRYEMEQHCFFSGIDSDTFELICSHLHQQTISADQYIFLQGADADKMYIILSGAVEIFTTTAEEGKETLLDVLGKGDVIGEIAVLDGGSRTAGAKVVSDTQLLYLSRQSLLNLVGSEPKIAMRIINVLCSRLRQTDKYIEEITTLPATQRLAKALLRLFEKHGRQKDGYIELPSKFTQGSIGAHAALRRENVNREIRVWRKNGVMLNEKYVHKIANLDCLRRVADTSDWHELGRFSHDVI